MKQQAKRKAISEEDNLEPLPYPFYGGPGEDPEDIENLGPTGHGPDICYSDADPGL